MPARDHVAQLARGFAMGTADIVPGVSGGTVALVMGIYERLIHNVHAGAQLLRALLSGDRGMVRSRWRMVEWRWLLVLLLGILTAIVALSSLLTHLLQEQPVRTASVFFGLVIGAVLISLRRLTAVTVAHIGFALGSAAALFAVLGLRSDTESDAATAITQPWWAFLLAGALAICAMILPGISGSLILVMIGMYAEFLGAVRDRDVLMLGAAVLGGVIGLALFSSLLDWALRRYHDLVLAAMIGLMLGSLRVLWPWPAGTSTTRIEAPRADVVLPILLAALGAAVVLAADLLAQRATSEARRETPSTSASSPNANENLA